MDILVDSTLAHMFGPEGAAVYFARLLKADVRSLRPTMTQEWPHAFFIMTNPPPTAAAQQQNASNAPPPTLYISRRPAHLLDYTIRQVGTVVPQGIWPPGNTSSADTTTSRGGTAKAASLNMPIFFVGMDRVSLGLPLPVAIAEGDRVQLQGAGSPAQIGHGSTTYIRITVSTKYHPLDPYLLFLSSWRVRRSLQWPGYSEWTTQIMTRDQTPAHNTITLGKFAKRLASAVGRFMEVSN